MAKGWLPLLLGVLVLCLCVEGLPSLPSILKREDRKQLSGPPSEFSAMDLPDEEDVFVAESSALLVVDLFPLRSHNFRREGYMQYEGDVTFPVDSKVLFRLTLTHRSSSSLPLSSLRLTSTSSNETISLPLPVKEVWPMGDSPREDIMAMMQDVQGISKDFGRGNDYLVALTWTFPSPSRGVWRLSFVVEEERVTFNMLHRVAIILYNENPSVVLDVSANSLGMHTGDVCGVQAELSESAHKNTVILSGQVHFTLPDGTTTVAHMTKNGNVWSGTMVCTQGGSYISEALVEGLTAENVPFIRSAQVPFYVVDDPIKLTGKAEVSQMTPQRLSFHIGVNGPSENKYRAYAEVYGHSKPENTVGSELQNSSLPSVVPVAWMSSIVNIEASLSSPHLSSSLSPPFEYFFALELDMDWLSLASVRGPFVLRNVILQCANTGVEITMFPAEIALSLSSTMLKNIQKHLQMRPASHITITEEMREGIRPLSLTQSPRVNSVKMVLVHGYCAGDNPWERDRAIWGSSSYYFKDLNANRGNDEFAMRIRTFMEAQGILNDPLAILGHSQGGMAIAHLYNYYWTGLNIPRNAKPLQAVGTPWQGCSMAGSSASLGSIFGVGCGTNYDLTPSGASSWLPGISSSTRSVISYYQTTYRQGSFLGDYCNLAANSILSFPNDGTTEQKYARLPNANFMGETQEQCHVTGMKYMAQYHDSARNQVIMNNAQP